MNKQTLIELVRAKIDEIEEINIFDDKLAEEIIMKFEQINTDIEEGKLLIAALAKITTEFQTDKTPKEVLKQLIKLKDKMDF